MINESSAHTYRRIFPAVVAAIVFLAFVGIADAQNQKFQFGVIGDTSYSKVAEQEFERLMARAVYSRAGDRSRKQGQLTGGLTNGLRRTRRTAPLTQNVSRYRIECFLANFIPGTIGRSGGIDL